MWIDRLQSRLQTEISPEVVERHETHISWVLLAGEWAWKFKKPVNFGFIDFSTLEKRRFACEEELRINRRTAAELYVAVATVTGSETEPTLNGTGPILDYAVQMRRFPTESLAATLLAQKALTRDQFTALARSLAEFQQAAEVATPESNWGQAVQVFAPVGDTIETLERALQETNPNASEEQSTAPNAGQPAASPDRRDNQRGEQLQTIRNWCASEFARLRGWFAERKQQGRIRECHGDLHLGNLVLWNGLLTPFDAIEFNPALRRIDVANELAFTTMDLIDRGRADLSAWFLNQWLEQSGDYAALAGLRFYQVYRALVRAKVAWLQRQPLLAARIERETNGRTIPESATESELREREEEYLALAERLIAPREPRLWITCGVAGSGKSTGTADLLCQSGAIRIRSDVERQRLHGRTPESKTPAHERAAVYSPAGQQQVYDRLLQLSEQILTSGNSVIVDATFLSRRQRDLFAALAARLGVPFEILLFDQPLEQLVDRVRQREKSGSDASEAGEDVLREQWQRWERPAAEEPARRMS